MMNDLQNGKIASDLLAKAKKEVEKSIDNDPFRSFNVFEVLSVQYKEVIMCRMLKDLLDPKGKHGKGNKFLKLFFKVIKESKGEIVPEEDLDDVNKIFVKCEYEIFGNRRIDILIRVGARYIPIEVKIYAGEQQNQVCDYLNYCQTRQEQAGNKGKTVLLYLTIDGHFPSEYSTGNLDNNQDKVVIPISFRDDICKFLELSLEESANDCLESNLKQYLFAIETISGKVSSPVLEALSSMLKTKDDFKAVEALIQALKESKTNFLRELFELIEGKLVERFSLHNQEKRNSSVDVEINAIGQLSQSSLKIITPYKDSSIMNDKTLLNNYYSEKVYPNIVLQVGNVNFDGKEYVIGIIFEIEDRSYVGIMLASKDKNGCLCSRNDYISYKGLLDDLTNQLEKIDNIKKCQNVGWFLDWHYVSANSQFEDKERSPNFKNCNDEYYDLLDSADERENFASKVVRSFEKYLVALKDLSTIEEC